MAAYSIITVDLRERSYPIIVGAGLLDGRFDLSPFIGGSDCLIVSDETVAALYGDRILANLGDKTVAMIMVPDGESHKSIATMQRILDRLVEEGAGRDTTVIALGGGIVGDISGFAAACYMRGVAFIQIPTTLLAQVDSSVGGKTGVNHPQGKNLIGAFHQPKAVLIDTETLRSLPDREFRAGLAEVIKYGAICDLDFFGWLETNMQRLLQQDAAVLAIAIQRCCELKAAVVAEDERESGRRAILNFGHTFGHAIEQCEGYGEWLHGEAVAVGMIMAAALSNVSAVERERLSALVLAAGLPIAPPGIAAERWMRAMRKDKKVTAKQLHFVLLRALGDAHVTASFDAQNLRHIIGGDS